MKSIQENEIILDRFRLEARSKKPFSPAIKRRINERRKRQARAETVKIDTKFENHSDTANDWFPSLMNRTPLTQQLKRGKKKERMNC